MQGNNKISMAKATSVYCYNCGFAGLYSFYPLYVFYHLQLPALFGTSSHQIPRGRRTRGGESSKQNRKEKWIVGGREYFLLGYLGQSNKFLFWFGFTSVSSSGALTPTSKMDRNVKIQESTEGGYIWEEAAAHNKLRGHREDVLRGYLETTGDSVPWRRVYCMSTACLVLFKILPVLQPSCPAER